MYVIADLLECLPTNYFSLGIGTLLLVWGVHAVFEMRTVTLSLSPNKTFYLTRATTRS